ncbi:MAG TPA: DUF4097 family beta strand repeat-containing protein [Pyrinomonadaceae bacterium]
MTHIFQKFILAVLAAAITGSFSLGVAAQATPKPEPTAKPKIKTQPPDAGVPPPPARHDYKYKYSRGGTYEKAIAVAPNINLTLCVTEGNLRINSWNRSEVRVYVEGGPKFAFKVVDKGPDGRPVWISAMNLQATPGVNAECIWGETVEVDAPAGTSLKLTGKEINAQVDGMRKVNVKTVGGDISLRNIKEGVSAYAGEGGVTVEESWGQVNLETTNGNIVVVDSGPSDIGDTFRAKTNSGAVSLTRVTHRALDVSSISGSVLFNGEIKSGGTYTFGTTNGTIRLALPSATGCKLAATFRSGSFASELPFKIETMNVAPGDLKSIVAKLGGGGDAVLRLSAFAGLIGIKKQ